LISWGPLHLRQQASKTLHLVDFGNFLSFRLCPSTYGDKLNVESFGIIYIIELYEQP